MPRPRIFAAGAIAEIDSVTIKCDPGIVSAMLWPLPWLTCIGPSRYGDGFRATPTVLPG